MGNTIWELFCIEHGISPDGDLVKTKDVSKNSFTDSAKTFFAVTEDKMIPRLIMVDLEPTVLGKGRLFLLIICSCYCCCCFY